MLPEPITTIGRGRPGIGHLWLSEFSVWSRVAIERWSDASMRREETIMGPTIVKLTARDIRMPTSESKAGSDAMHVDPDYSAAYVTLETDARDGIIGCGMAFTLGRGNEVCVAAIDALKPFVLGLSLEKITADMAGFWRRLSGESQLRWIGPEKGAIHLATAAIVNAVWDLWAKV